MIHNLAAFANGWSYGISVCVCTEREAGRGKGKGNEGESFDQMLKCTDRPPRTRTLTQSCLPYDDKLFCRNSLSFM